MVTTKPIVVGLSANVLDAQVADTRIDGIGVYTLSLERCFDRLGVVTMRVGAPVLRGLRLVRPRASKLAFTVPSHMGLAWTALSGGGTPFAKRLSGALDLYHATDNMVPRLKGIPVVATIYDAIPLAHPKWASPRLRQTKNWLLRRSARSADLVIAISRAAASELIEHYRLPESRIRVVPLGVDAMWFDPPEPETIDATLARFALRRGYFLFVGSLQPRKNVGAILAAYDALPASIRQERQLVIAGKYGWSVRELEADLMARREQNRCVWVDYVDRESLHALYAAAGAFIFPSLAEGFGLPVLEAMAASIPVIASDLPALREVANGHATLVPPGNVAALLHEMENVASRPNDPLALQRAQEHARAMSWETCAGRTLAVYRELLQV